MCYKLDGLSCLGILYRCRRLARALDVLKVRYNVRVDRMNLMRWSTGSQCSAYVDVEGVMVRNELF